MNVREKLGKSLLIFDGAMGTLLQERGLAAGETPENWNIEHPDQLLAIHAAYLAAGSDIISANTFGANRYKYQDSRYTVAQVVEAGIKNAKQAVAQSGRDAAVALDIGSLGKLLKPLGTLPFEEAVSAFAEIIEAGAQAGADVVLIETMSDTYEIKAAVLAAKEHCTLPVFVTVILDERGRLLTGGDVAAVVAMLEGLGVDAIGLNCGLGTEQVLERLPALTACCATPIMLQPNAGLPTVVDGKTVFCTAPEPFAADMAELVRQGASVVGGCCGTTPAHIAALTKACRGLPLARREVPRRTVIASYTHAVTLGDRPRIIGERINPTGKSRFKQALREHNMEYIYREGLTQQDKGADILDVNVGLPEIDEPALMEEAICGLQAILDLPLQIDTTDLVAMERALRIYNGKPLLNSVNGKRESMETVFPLAKKYGAAVVCLCLDEDGIPETAEGRVRVAQKIIDTAASYGIGREDLIVDTLTMTISTGSENARVTLDALKTVREQLGVQTTLGVSNVSFGLPERATINSAFFTLALQHGLSAGIVNPSSTEMMGAFYSYLALAGLDPQCAGYIASRTDAPSAAAPAAQSSTVSLHDAVVRGLSESAAAATAARMADGADGLAVINEELIPALDVVGQGFEQKRLFLPQLLMSAEAASASFEVIRGVMAQSGKQSEARGTIIIATVKGDIHDIGKNIVKTLLENYGYRMIDLGRDVPPEEILAAAQRETAPVVALSALMTTTVVSMQQTIELLRREKPDTLIMVGGAVLTQEYADQIGADFYSKDAMGSVRYANELHEAGVL